MALPEPLCVTLRARQDIFCFVRQTFHYTGKAVRFFELFSYECRWLTLWKCFLPSDYFSSHSQWPRGLRCSSTAAGLLGLCVRNAPSAWVSVSCKRCLLLGRGICDGLIPHPGESYRVWCAWVWSWTTIISKFTMSTYKEVRLRPKKKKISFQNLLC